MLIARFTASHLYITMNSENLKIPSLLLSAASRDKFFTDILAAMVMVKAQHSNSIITNFSIRKFKKMLRTSTDKATKILNFLLEENLAGYRFTKNGRCDLRLASLRYNKKQKVSLVSYVHICDSPAGKQIYLSSNTCDNEEKSMKSTTVQTLHDVVRIIEKLIVGKSIQILISKRNCVKNAKTNTVYAKQAKYWIDRHDKFVPDYSKMSLLQKCEYASDPHVTYPERALEILHKAYDNTSGRDHSIYAPNSASQEAISNYAFGGTRSLRTVKRLIKEMIVDDCVLETKHHARPVYFLGNEGNYNRAFRNIFDESCFAFCSKRTKYKYNQKHTDEILKDVNKACVVAYLQPWPNSYKIQSTDFRFWAKYTV